MMGNDNFKRTLALHLHDLFSPLHVVVIITSLRLDELQIGFLVNEIEHTDDM